MGKSSTSCFNPHRARRPGATGHLHPQGARLPEVSILTGPEGPVQPPRTDIRIWRKGCFNPHRARRPGATIPPPKRPCNRRTRFQSSPGPKARCNPALVLCLLQCPPSFNPHRARRPGATIPAIVGLALEQRFQSSPGPKARCNEPYSGGYGNGWGWVSILTGPEGPVQQVMRGILSGESVQVSILTGPEGPVQRGQGHGGVCQALGVSILTGPEGPVQLGCGVEFVH